MNRRHTYEIRVAWTGNLGKGSSSYKGYSRDYDIVCKGKPGYQGFRGYRGALAREGQCHVFHRQVREFPGRSRAGNG